MEKEFINYTEASILNELGFDEPCFGYYTGDKKHLVLRPNMGRRNEDLNDIVCTSPLYQQAFRWFRDIHGLYHTICPEFYRDGINFNWQILWYLPKEEWTEYVICDGTVCYGDNGEYPSQEEAELACLKKLIEIVKQK